MDAGTRNSAGRCSDLFLADRSKTERPVPDGAAPGARIRCGA